ncbi:MAG TPA: GNAT family protein, partial [Ilumatobacteraceae bacterium]|nr:GNAT family protein [Ilumatobacteraceae bacterium]
MGADADMDTGATVGLPFEPIRTERLLLRPMRESDADAFFERRNHPDVARYQTWTLPYPRERAERVVASVIEMGRPVADDTWMLTVADLDDTEVYGDLVLELKWGTRTAEIGYTLHPRWWARGFALEASEALVAYAFETLDVTRVQGMLHPDNHASAMVLERLGLIFEGHTRSSFWVGDECSDDWIYGMTRADWDAWRTRARTRPELVELVELESDTVVDAAKLVTHKSQERFVAPVLYSLAQALVPEVDEGVAVVPWYRGI